jgi:hypothetical protein
VLRAILLATAVVAAAGCASSCCWWSSGEYHATRLPQPLAAPPADPLRLVIDAPTIKILLDEVARRRPVFHGPVPLPAVTRKLGSGCRAPRFGDCDPCKDYGLLSHCNMLRQGNKPCDGQPRVTNAAALRWANQPCAPGATDCAVLVTGVGLSVATEGATYEISLTGAALTLGEGRLHAHAELNGLTVRGTTVVKLLDRCGQRLTLPLLKLPERCEGVEAGIANATPIRLDAGLVLERRDQELRGRLDGDLALKLPPGGAYLKQTCYRGSFLGYDVAEVAERETVGALEREWPRREAQAQRALQAWLADRLARPLVDAIPPSFQVAAAGSQITFLPRLEKVTITPAAITVEADAQVIVPYDLVNAQLAALGRLRVSKAGEDPLWLSELKAEAGPGGTLLLRAAYEYEWHRGAITGGGKGHLAFAGRGELKEGTLRFGEVTLVEVVPKDSGCFDARMRRRVEAALKGHEIRRLQIKLQAQLDAAVERLRATRVTRDGLAMAFQPDSLSARPSFERQGVRLDFAGFLRPRLIPAAGARPPAPPAGTPAKGP